MALFEFVTTTALHMTFIYCSIFVLSFLKPMVWALYLGSVLIGFGAASKCKTIYDLCIFPFDANIVSVRTFYMNHPTQDLSQSSYKDRF